MLPVNQHNLKSYQLVFNPAIQTQQTNRVTIMERDIYKSPTSDLTSADEIVKYAGFWIRTGASVIDTILIILIILPVFTLMYGPDYWLGESISTGPIDILLNYILPAIAVIAFWIYKSATPGKMLCKIKIISTKDGNAPGMGQSIGRYLAYYVSMIPFFLGFIWIAFDKNKRGWHDKLSSTAVVHEKNL